MKINKWQQICDINDCYKALLLIIKEFLSNKVLWICEKYKKLLNQTKNRKQKQFYYKSENLKIIFDYENDYLKPFILLKINPT